MSTLTIPPRFNGPPTSGHGGYTCGAVAALVDVPVRVELRAPPPLGTPMDVTGSADGVEVHAGDTLVVRARPEAPPALLPPARVGVEEARAAVAGYPGFVEHPFPTCFACGPQRAPGDGLRIFPGPVAGGALVAAPWTPDASLRGDDGSVAPVHVWAALDCPSYFGVGGGRLAVLASLGIRQDAPVPVAEEVVVLGWGQREEGRKLHGASAILDRDGQLLAVADALWITIDAPPEVGQAASRDAAEAPDGPA